MSGSSHFVIAVHATALLAHLRDDAPLCSEYIAGSVNTNPVIIRRVMGKLVKAGIVAPTSGRNGGFSLARPAREVTLADVSAAIHDDEQYWIFAGHPRQPNTKCPVGAQIESALRSPLDDASRAVDEALARTTLADLQHRIEGLLACSPDLPED